MLTDNLFIVVSLAFILFSVIFTVSTGSLVCVETNDKGNKNA
jgi:hypothetical protein